jgi:hypothetical protein
MLITKKRQINEYDGVLIVAMNSRIEKIAEDCGFRSNPDIYDRNQSFDIPGFANSLIDECVANLQLNGYDDAAECLKQLKDNNK